MGKRCQVCADVFLAGLSEPVQCAGCGRSLVRVMTTALEAEVVRLRGALAQAEGCATAIAEDRERLRGELRAAADALADASETLHELQAAIPVPCVEVERGRASRDQARAARDRAREAASKAPSWSQAGTGPEGQKEKA